MERVFLLTSSEAPKVFKIAYFDFGKFFTSRTPSRVQITEGPILNWLTASKKIICLSDWYSAPISQWSPNWFHQKWVSFSAFQGPLSKPSRFWKCRLNSWFWNIASNFCYLLISRGLIEFENCPKLPKNSMFKAIHFLRNVLVAFILIYVVFIIKMLIWWNFQLIWTIFLYFHKVEPPLKGQSCIKNVLNCSSTLSKKYEHFALFMWVFACQNYKISYVFPVHFVVR